MATTTNYGWATPDDTDLVKDGAAAIRTLGSSIDTSFVADEGDLLVGGINDIFEALPIGAAGTVLTSDGDTAEWVAPASGGNGLALISTTTIGSTVSSVTVSNAFSATYDNYRIIVSGGVSSTSNGGILKLGSTTSGYEQTDWNTNSGSSSVSVAHFNNVQGFDTTRGSVNSHVAIVDILCPFLSKYTSLYGWNQRSVSTFVTSIAHGTLTNTTSYTAFTLTATAGTFTGGTIKVYGYQNS
jgi:hypothetical protein